MQHFSKIEVIDNKESLREIVRQHIFNENIIVQKIKEIENEPRKKV